MITNILCTKSRVRPRYHPQVFIVLSMYVSGRILVVQLDIILEGNRPNAISLVVSHFSTLLCSL